MQSLPTYAKKVVPRLPPLWLAEIPRHVNPQYFASLGGQVSRFTRFQLAVSRSISVLSWIALQGETACLGGFTLLFPWPELARVGVLS